MKDPFTYIPPNDVTAPKYAAIRAAWDRALTVCRDAVVDTITGGGSDAARYTAVNDVTRAFADVIMEQAPPLSADTSAAYRCVRLARMAANEAISCAARGDTDGAARNDDRCADNLIAARWQACAAIALEG